MKAVAILTILMVIAVAAPAAQQMRPLEELIASSSALYAKLFPLFRAFHPRLSNFKILDRRPLNTAYTLLLVHATVPDIHLVQPADPARPENIEGFRQESFGLFVIDAISGKLYMTVAIFATGRWLDYTVVVEAADERHIDIRREGQMYGDGEEWVRYFLNLSQRRVLNAVRHFRVHTDAIVEFGGELYFIARVSEENSIVTKFTPKVSSFMVIDTINGQTIEQIRVARAERGRLVLQSPRTQYVLSGDRWQVSPNPDAQLFRNEPGSGAAIGLPEIRFDVPLYVVRERIVTAPSTQDASRRLLVWHDPTTGADGVFVLSRSGQVFHPLQQPAYALFNRLRPKRVEDGYTEDGTTFENGIGPFQFDGRRLWFGVSFYDGEGSSGVGGIGTFDPSTGAYRIRRLAALNDWSVSALRLDGRYIWLGLASYGEGRTAAGGLLRYEPPTGAVRRYPIPQVITAIHRLGNSLYLGTSNGIFILKGDTLRRLVFEIDVNGK